jgi:hypothetical protein
MIHENKNVLKNREARHGENAFFAARAGLVELFNLYNGGLTSGAGVIFSLRNYFATGAAKKLRAVGYFMRKPHGIPAARVRTFEGCNLSHKDKDNSMYTFKCQVVIDKEKAVPYNRTASVICSDTTEPTSITTQTQSGECAHNIPELPCPSGRGFLVPETRPHRR